MGRGGLMFALQCTRVLLCTLAPGTPAVTNTSYVVKTKHLQPRMYIFLYIYAGLTRGKP
jgi:hypothetical protein